MSSTSWESILVAVRDPSAPEQMAIRKAARIAARCGARITLFHAFSTATPLPDTTPSEAGAILRVVAKQRRQQLLKLAGPLRKQGIKVQCDVVWDFPPAHAIVRQVLKTKPDLVVAQSHRHSRIARWFLANSDWDLIRDCPCPVWFVKHERLAKTPMILTAIDPTHAHAKPSGLDDRLLRTATSVMNQLGGKIALIHVEDTSRTAPAGFLGRPVKARANTSDESDSVAAVTVDAVASLSKRHKIAAENQLLLTGIPADMLSASASEIKADLLVMGAVSRSAQSHSHIGNTAETVIDTVTSDVLVVKPRQFKTAVPRKSPKLPVY